eukprot:13017379-Alexandrium_andersonii.AAC.1
MHPRREGRWRWRMHASPGGVLARIMPQEGLLAAEGWLPRGRPLQAMTRERPSVDDGLRRPFSQDDPAQLPSRLHPPPE